LGEHCNLFEVVLDHEHRFRGWTARSEEAHDRVNIREARD
jgi:hypothetical protein